MTSPTDLPLRHTPMYEQHRELGARLVPFAGWEMPIQYAGITEEHGAVRTAAGLFDVSHMGELELKGQYALEVINYLVTNDVAKLEDGQAAYTCACNEQGGILDDLIVYRAARDRWVVVCNASNRDKMSAHFAKACEHHCEFRDISDETALLALQGPKAIEILSLAGNDAAACASLKRFHFRDAVVGNMHATVARTGYTGEDGVEIFCSVQDAPALWRVLMDLGRPMGLQPVGLGARDTLRLEACLSLYGNDINETTHPWEAGLGWVVKMNKGDFVGREALEGIKTRGLTRKLIGFEMLGRGVARHGYMIKDPRLMADPPESVVGVCTSGSPGPTLAKNVGLGYVPLALSEVGTKILVDCRGKNIEAMVVKTPFYRRPVLKMES